MAKITVKGGEEVNPVLCSSALELCRVTDWEAPGEQKK
jgi:hypothetical protein